MLRMRVPAGMTTALSCYPNHMSANPIDGASPAQILAGLWTAAAGDPAALARVTLTGAEPTLPSSFRVGAAAQTTLAASALAAAEIWRLRSGRAQAVGVDM